MDKGQGGIQQLLAAEQEAQNIINKARNAKMTRLRQAKEEAEREVAAYRAQRENEYVKKLKETSGDTGNNLKRLEAETATKIKHLSAEASKVSHEVTALLLKEEDPNRCFQWIETELEPSFTRKFLKLDNNNKFFLHILPFFISIGTKRGFRRFLLALCALFMFGFAGLKIFSTTNGWMDGWVLNLSSLVFQGFCLMMSF